MNVPGRITVAQLQTGGIAWNLQPYQDIPGAAMIEFPTVSDDQIAVLKNGVPQEVQRVLSLITKFR